MEMQPEAGDSFKPAACHTQAPKETQEDHHQEAKRRSKRISPLDDESFVRGWAEQNISKRWRIMSNKATTLITFASVHQYNNSARNSSTSFSSLRMCLQSAISITIQYIHFVPATLHDISHWTVASVSCPNPFLLGNPQIQITRATEVMFHSCAGHYSHC